ncbi:hypothetical protein ZOSMA_5G00240 [Zostera marina]|uniref:AB hydrolase-1 domain-containing protein n=1 Tax=Zostera marina TaxID=29655 RepID=A0A0K9NU71_ZOSMR|nr:hypothetical protein ZOSMA_5G00240 [Zostera marina]
MDCVSRGIWIGVDLFTWMSHGHVCPKPTLISSHRRKRGGGSCGLRCIVKIRNKETGMEGDESIHRLRSEFIEILRSRRNPDVAPNVELGKPVLHPMDQGGAASREAMESCPRENIENLKDRLSEEFFYITTEVGEQGRLPVFILSLKEESSTRKPAIVFLHSSYKNKEWLRPLLEAYASRGYICVAIDSRYHGERASNNTAYRDALLSSWKTGNTMPFIYDTVWDLIKLGDYLSQRKDIDPTRIGITGESLGGMHAWFAAFVDTRYTVIAPIIGVQGFRWAQENNQWQARVNSIKPMFEEARIDLGKSEIDKEVVEKVWNRIAPGLASQFDSPYTFPSLAPRPLIVANGADDPRCPLAGLQVPFQNTKDAYKKFGLSENFEVIIENGIGHQMTSSMVKAASDWFDRFLK